MENHLSQDKISILLQFIQLIIALIGLRFQVSSLLIIIFISTILTIIFIVQKQRNVNQYVSFIEYLINNEHHNFILLPKLRMFINAEKLNNKMTINEMHVEYNIKQNKYEKLIGDLEITYHLWIENKEIPNQIDFIMGNDYSLEKQNMVLKYGAMEREFNVPASRQIAAPYWREQIRHYSIELNPEYIPKTGDLKLTMKVTCDRSFNFKDLPRDTIIFLPKIFSDDIKKVQYKIQMNNFGTNKFYCDAYKIYSNHKGFTTTGIECKTTQNNLFETNIKPNTVNGEKAYYFRVGLAEQDEEYTL